MKKPTPEEIKAASYPAIQERAREMDKAGEKDPMQYGGGTCAPPAPKPDASSEDPDEKWRWTPSTPDERLIQEWKNRAERFQAENQKLRGALKRISGFSFGYHQGCTLYSANDYAESLRQISAVCEEALNAK